LKLMRTIRTTYIEPATPIAERIRGAVFIVYFLRLWHQDLHRKGLEDRKNRFITRNAYEGLELNLILVIKLALESRSENIHLMNSQCCENFFRLLRSQSTIDSSIVNFSMKSLLSRVHKIQFVEGIMTTMKDELQFPKMLHRQMRLVKEKETISEDDIKAIIKNAIRQAKEEARNLKMKVQTINLREIINTTGCSSDNIEYDDDSEEEEGDLFGIGDLNNDDEVFERIDINGLKFSNIPTGIYK
jgi:hypothetical protein